jgi:1-aminocyclopropane-1-carboxylate deaminase/D-cysteine desulfhydrase-like pyridoxal-dependent ACC family enzyme
VQLGRRAFLGTVLASFLARPAGAQRAAPSRPLLARAELPWIDLGGLPTRVEPADVRLSRHLGVSLWIKRDDLAGEGFGGSKARKLELFLADALERGHQRVLTFGGAGSNHALATAFHARRLGLACTLVLLPEPRSEHVRRHLLAAHGLGASLIAGTRADREDPARLIARLGEHYVIPQGGTSPLGNLGYVGAGLELADQRARGELPVPRRIYMAGGTTGAAAGLYVGLRAGRLGSELVVVRASGRGTANDARLAREIDVTAQRLRALDPTSPSVRADARSVRVDHRAAGDGYAIPSEEGARAAALARELGALTLDSTYTAKAFAALVRDAPSLRGEDVLFWNTYDAREVATDAEPGDLPASFRRYF